MDQGNKNDATLAINNQNNHIQQNVNNNNNTGSADNHEGKGLYNSNIKQSIDANAFEGDARGIEKVLRKVNNPKSITKINTNNRNTSNNFNDNLGRLFPVKTTDDKRALIEKELEKKIRLLQNKDIVDNLPDKGLKIKTHIDELRRQLASLSAPSSEVSSTSASTASSVSSASSTSVTSIEAALSKLALDKPTLSSEQSLTTKKEIQNPFVVPPTAPKATNTDTKINNAQNSAINSSNNRKKLAAAGPIKERTIVTLSLEDSIAIYTKRQQEERQRELEEAQRFLARDDIRHSGNASSSTSLDVRAFKDRQRDEEYDEEDFSDDDDDVDPNEELYDQDEEEDDDVDFYGNHDATNEDDDKEKSFKEKVQNMYSMDLIKAADFNPQEE